MGEGKPLSEVVITPSTDIDSISGTTLTGADWTPLLQNLDIALSVIRDTQRNVASQSLGLDETVAQSITLDCLGRTVLEIHASADTATTFTLEASTDNTNWFTITTWSSVTSVDETWTNGYEYIRLSSNAAGAAGDLVDLVLSGAR